MVTPGRAVAKNFQVDKHLRKYNYRDLSTLSIFLSSPCLPLLIAPHLSSPYLSSPYLTSPLPTSPYLSLLLLSLPHFNHSLLTLVSPDSSYLALFVLIFCFIYPCLTDSCRPVCSPVVYLPCVFMWNPSSPWGEFTQPDQLLVYSQDTALSPCFADVCWGVKEWSKSDLNVI